MRARIEPLPGQRRLAESRRRHEHDRPRLRLVEQARDARPLDDVAANAGRRLERFDRHLVAAKPSVERDEFLVAGKAVPAGPERRGHGAVSSPELV